MKDFLHSLFIFLCRNRVNPTHPKYMQNIYLERYFPVSLRAFQSCICLNYGIIWFRFCSLAEHNSECRIVYLQFFLKCELAVTLAGTLFPYRKLSPSKSDKAVVVLTSYES